MSDDQSVKAYIKTSVMLATPQERDGKPGFAVRYGDGYTSWCPKDTFEATARKLQDDEGLAITSEVPELEVFTVVTAIKDTNDPAGPTSVPYRRKLTQAERDLAQRVLV